FMTRKKIYINYAQTPDDIKLFEDIYQHLGIINEFEMWHRGKIIAGSDIELEVKKNFSESEVLLPLLSINYVSNEECMKKFMLAKEANKEVIPLLLSPFDIESIAELHELRNKILPDDEEPIDTAPNRNVVYARIAVKLRKKLTGKSSISIPDNRKFL